MPLKRRVDKRRIDPRADMEAWSSTFDCGVTFDGDLDPVGIPTAIGRPTSAEIEQAWHRLGSAYIAERGHETGHGAPLWCLRQFGEPSNG